MQADPFQANRELERELCLYTGSRFAVCVSSCTMALLIALAWERWRPSRILGGAGLVGMPRLTYVGVAYSALHAGFPGIAWRDEDWQGMYHLGGTRVYDAARRFTSQMYCPGTFQCVSFHISKILGHSQGGAILHDCAEADEWLRRARFDGRTEGVPAAQDKFTQFPAWHAYLSPDTAAALRWKLSSLPRHNDNLLRDNYPDLSLHPAFQMGKTPA
jgi:dTDP-4-amino-4,6-dideoxygalactose transaminase